MRNRCYTELSKLKTFRERFEYLRLDGSVGAETFGFDRYINQVFYKSPEWKHIRDIVIMRDNGCDLGVEGYEIMGYRDKNNRYHKPIILIHHMIPITKQQILNRDPIVFDPEILISCAQETHNAIHYGDETTLVSELVIRKPNDTIPWRH